MEKRERSGLQEKCQGLPRENAGDGKLPLYIHHDKDWIRQKLWMKGKPKRKFWKFWFDEKQNQRGNSDEKQDSFLGLPTNCLLVTKEGGGEGITMKKSDILAGNQKLTSPQRDRFLSRASTCDTLWRREIIYAAINYLHLIMRKY